ncbi:MAG TPA: class I SAM-dependent methyltransferase [Anaerolineae bacterium]|nr:class I SAM-dependent methyltransferase [Anaerolineae bacterium]HNT05756.1 class I SAM-dependent methyltransferase [Anaerolineae bacterium]HOU22769.1 class I SAM-dependent methyltransferase [Anaerolineae bacterium]HQJ50296.1 class I SAM-dependent methyltransferase [Anaerolineae bacterium]
MEQVRCNLCGADDTRLIAVIDQLRIVRCKRCGLTYVNPRLAQSELQEIYTESYYDHDGIVNGLEFFGYEDYVADEENIKLTFADRLRTIEKLTAPGRLLDIGCATGFFLALARDNGWQVVGTEVSTFSAGYARERLGLDVRLGTLKSLGFEAGSFDTVTMWDVLEHVTDPMAELGEIARILRTGGVLSIITPDAGSLVARILGDRWEEYRRVREHVYFFSRRTLSRMLNEVGFEILKVESAGKFFYLGPALERLKYYTWDGAITLAASKLVYRLGLGRLRVRVNPFTKMTVYARKR